MDYGDLASVHVPAPTRRRRDELLVWLRSADAPVTAREIVELSAPRLRRTYDVTIHDLGELARYGLARSAGHPQRWVAV